jgi:hypothetical protein
MKNALPYMVDFIGGFITYMLWSRGYISIIGVFCLIMSTALLSTCWTMYLEKEHE